MKPGGATVGDLGVGDGTQLIPEEIVQFLLAASQMSYVASCYITTAS